MRKLVTVQEQSLGSYEFANGMAARVTIIATRLREAMELRGVDQSALAEAIGVTQGTISLILLGKTRHSKYLPDIAIELNVAYDWLIGRHDDREADSPVELLITPTEHDLISMIRSMASLDGSAARRVIYALAATSPNQLPVSLPPEKALARMFEGLLRAMPSAATLEEQAELLARELPSGLAQLRD